jgi:uncharacterized protein (DUF736 family)
MEKAKDIGALWMKTSSKGTQFMSGTINGQRVVVFRNERKQEGERTPDWRIYPETPRDEGVSVTRVAQTASSRTDDDIPF